MDKCRFYFRKIASNSHLICYHRIARTTYITLLNVYVAVVDGLLVRHTSLTYDLILLCLDTFRSNNQTPQKNSTLQIYSVFYFRPTCFENKYRQRGMIDLSGLNTLFQIQAGGTSFCLSYFNYDGNNWKTRRQ